MAKAEGKPKVLTLVNAAGPEVKINDKLEASLEAGTKVEFVKADGTVSCKKSKIKGKATSNPEEGSGNATVEIEALTLEECSSTVGGAGGTLEKIEVKELPLVAETEKTGAAEAFNFMSKPNLQVEVQIEVATPGGAKLGCVFRKKPVVGKYESNNGQLQIAEKIGEGVQFLQGCKCAVPNWKATYQPLKDESQGGKTVVIN